MEKITGCSKTGKEYLSVSIWYIIGLYFVWSVLHDCDLPVQLGFHMGHGWLCSDD